MTDVDSTTIPDFGGPTSSDIVQPTEPSLTEVTDGSTSTDSEEPTPEPQPTTETGHSSSGISTKHLDESTLEPEDTPEPEPTSVAPVVPAVTEGIAPTESVESPEGFPEETTPTTSDEEFTESGSTEHEKATEFTVPPSSERPAVAEATAPPQTAPGPENNTSEETKAGDGNGDAPAAPEDQPNKIVVIDGQRYLNSNGKLFPLPPVPSFVRPGGSPGPIKPFVPQPNQQPPRPAVPAAPPSQQQPKSEESDIRDGIGSVPPRRPPAPPQKSGEEGKPSVVVIDGQRFLKSGDKLFPLPGAPDVSSQGQGRPHGPVVSHGPQKNVPGPIGHPTSGVRPASGEHPGSFGHQVQGGHPAIGGHPAQGQDGRPVQGLRPVSGGRPAAGRRPTRPGSGVRPVLVGPSGERIHLGPDGRPLRPTSPGRRPGSSGRRPVFVPHSQESPEIIILPDGRRVQVFPDGSTRPLSRPRTSQRPQQQLIAIGRDGRPILGPDGRPITIPASAARRPTSVGRPPHHQQQQQQQQHQQQQVHPLRQQRPPSRGGGAGESLGSFAPGDRIPIDSRGRPIPIGPNGPVRAPVFDIIIGDDGRPLTDDDGRTMLFPVHGGGRGGGGPPPHRDQEPDDATLLLQHLATSTPAPEQEHHRPDRHEEGKARS